MHFSQALDAFSRVTLRTVCLPLISPLSELIEHCLHETGSVTLRKRRRALEMMVWSVVGMALFLPLPMSQIVNQLDIMLSGNRLFVAPSAVLQARQRLSAGPVQPVFDSRRRSGTSTRRPFTLVWPDPVGRRWRGLAHAGFSRKFSRVRTHPVAGKRISVPTSPDGLLVSANKSAPVFHVQASPH